jgi:hypothetical protein
MSFRDQTRQTDYRRGSRNPLFGALSTEERAGVLARAAPGVAHEVAAMMHTVTYTSTYTYICTNIHIQTYTFIYTYMHTQAHIYTSTCIYM